jgi:hypothetical protein
MNGYEVFCTYQAIKLHFSTDTYCYFKYNGHVATKEAGFEKRKDKYSFHKLARELRDIEVVDFFVATFLEKPKAYVTDFMDPDAVQRLRSRQRMLADLEAQFAADMDKIIHNKQDKGINSIFGIPHDGSMPLIWTMYVQGDITLETITILHGMTGILDKWDEKYSADYIYEKTSKLIRKYEGFLGVDVPKYAKIVQTHLTAA